MEGLLLVKHTTRLSSFPFVRLFMGEEETAEQEAAEGSTHIPSNSKEELPWVLLPCSKIEFQSGGWSTGCLVSSQPLAKLEGKIRSDIQSRSYVLIVSNRG